MHARRILLADIAALGIVDAVQLLRVGLQPERLVLAQFGRAFGDAMSQTLRAPGLRGISLRGRSKPAIAKLREARVGRCALLRIGRPMDGKPVFQRDRHRAAQAIQAQPLDQRLGPASLAIDQHILAAGRIGPQDHVEQGLALRRQQAGIARRAGREAQHVLGQQALQKGPRLGAADADQASIVEGGREHPL